MSNSVNKVVLIGIDAPIVSRVYNYAMQGKLPAFKRLIENGVFGENCLVPFPTITPPNWTTIATGAWPGTHGITDYHVHIPGDPLDRVHQGFDSRDCQSEYIWNVIERIGKKSIIFDYPSTWPPTIKDGIQLGGGGVGINSWRNETPGISLADDQLFSTEGEPLATQVELTEATGWQDESDTAEAQRVVPLEVELNLLYRAAREPMKRRSWYAIVRDSKGEGYDQLFLFESKESAEPFAKLIEGQWSPIITQEFETKAGVRKGAFRCKLLSLSEDGKCFRLYVTSINALEGWSYPESIAHEIKSQEGLPLPRCGYNALNLGWLDLDSLVEVVEYQHIWIADAASYLLKNKEWNLFFTHIHCPDWMYHTFSRKLEPEITETAERERYEKAELGLYQSLDRAIEGILASTDESTLTILTSDHGAKATTNDFHPGEVLAKVGLTVYKESGTRRSIDWTKTKAAVQRSCHVYINLKGRDPQGIVEPGEEYEEVREAVIRAFYDYTDPETGKKPITLALKREDARIIGLYGERVGDVIFAIDPAFGHEHGPFLPTAGYGMGSMRGLFIMSGPGVKKGHTLTRTVNLGHRTDYLSSDRMASSQGRRRVGPVSSSGESQRQKRRTAETAGELRASEARRGERAGRNT
jgi:predicted AlkP superfamily phosphohydrolase/phosphomutase